MRTMAYRLAGSVETPGSCWSTLAKVVGNERARQKKDKHNRHFRSPLFSTSTFVIKQGWAGLVNVG